MADAADQSAEVRRGRLMSSVQGLAATLMAIFQTRLELLATEVEEEKQRLLAVLGWGAVAILMGAVASVFLAGFITVLFWDTHPLLVLGLLTLAFAAVCLWAVRRVQAITASPEGMLAATLAELQADHDALLAAAQEGAQPEQKG
ncbi:phage holin family protein [Aquabacterium sp. NJ1]|uniref:phage holin family protein n=1 Tax=Aquabacterium sp. NJ1 TaxID=1538295 RepID=UPI00069066AD|nr:phage holin family protein [Aquabacterium sp. NJ1]